MWIVNEIEQQQRKSSYKKYVFLVIVLLAGSYFGYAYFMPEQEIENQEILTSVSVTTWDLKTSISWDGKVLYKEDYNLNFPITGTVKTLLKQEWDIVEKWEVIAKLDTTYLELAVDKAEIDLKKAEADLLAKRNQYSSSDVQLSQDQLESVQVSLDNVKTTWNIDIENAKSNITTNEIALNSAKIDLETAQTELELIKKQEEEKYSNKLEDIIGAIWKNVSFIKDNLLEIDLLLWITPENKDVNNSFDSYLGAKDSTSKNQATESFKKLDTEFTSFLSSWKEYRSGEEDLSKANEFLDLAESNTRLLNTTLNYTLETVKGSIVNINNLPQSQIDSYKTQFEKAIVDAKTEIHSLVDARQNAEEQKTVLDTKVTTQQNTISSLDLKYQLAQQKLNESQLALTNVEKKLENNVNLAEKQIEIAKTSLDAKTQEPSYSELAPFYTNIENQKKSLEEAQKKLEDAILKSPITGKIVTINGNIGSFVWWDKDTSFVTITNNNKFYVESYVEELDIARIQNDAKVYLTFDALDWVKLDGKVYFVSDKSTTDNNGVVTYKVEISFDPKNSWVREWMTTYVDYITNEVLNAKIIPVWAVKPVNGIPSVLWEDWQWKSIVTWFTDGKMVEIISGLEKWEKIQY